MKKIIVIISLFTFFGCEKMVTDVEPPNVEEKLVLFAFLSPEELTVDISVSLSNPVFNSKSPYPQIVTDAIVEIADSKGLKEILSFDVSKLLYTVDQTKYRINPGETYTITAKKLDKTVVGITTIPLTMVEVKEVELVKTGNAIGSNLPYAKLKTVFTDIANQVNYYRLTTNFTNKKLNYISDMCNTFFDDINKSGNDYTSVCDISVYEKSGGSDEVNTFLLTTDLHYYQYHIRRINQVEDNPFSEPYQLYTNVNGGLGCVGSYRQNRITTLIE